MQIIILSVEFKNATFNVANIPSYKTMLMCGDFAILIDFIFNFSTILWRE